jgi:hypothetical protein
LTKRGDIVRGITGFALLTSLTLPSGAVSACPAAAAHEARLVRDFQTMLMVSALKCARQSPEMLASYNQFVSRTRPILASAAETLRRDLVRVHGAKEAPRLYDRQVTAVANTHSSIVRSTDWCAQATTLANRAAALEPAALAEIAREALGINRAEQCRSD